ncbi:MAG: hypothetical protein MI922_01250, partial [Bacteroidales bacterium]|nr:hypothetical protein [Bacteroidales bacterium]
FLPGNMQYWMHAQARLDMYCLSRGSAVALSKEISANSASWQGFKAFMQQANIKAGMNTGIMNKSWEFDDPAKWMKNWSGDIRVIENLKSAGFTHVTMYMQSVLSKGGLSTFDPTAGGAPLSVRVEDCITYAKYIEENKPDGIEVDYALIDAFPAKAGIQKLDYRGAYHDLVKAFQREGIPFVGIMIDMKSNTVKNNANSLLKDCKWIENELSDSTGQTVYAGWWAWDKTESKAQSCEFIKKAYLNIDNHTDGEYCSHIAIGGTGENRTKVEDLIPADDINGIFSCAARLNQAFSFWELEAP